MQGISHAAIQGLVEELKEQDARHRKDLAARDRTIEQLKTGMRALREQVQRSLPPAP